MRKNGDKPAFARPYSEGKWDHNKPQSDICYGQDGLTKREYFAAMAMQGLIASGCTIDIDKERPFQTRAATCIMMADELLIQLENK